MISRTRDRGPKQRSPLRLVLCNVFLVMDRFDFRPKFSPVVGHVPYRFSVGAYRGKRRVVIAWFLDESAANDYLIRCRRDYPKVKFDYLQSLM